MWDPAAKSYLIIIHGLICVTLRVPDVKKLRSVVKYTVGSHYLLNTQLFVFLFPLKLPVVPPLFQCTKI